MTTTVEDLLIRLRDEDDLDGCAPAVAWLAARDGTLEQAWDACERGDWMVWLAEACEAYQDDAPSAAYIAAAEAYGYAVRTPDAIGRSWDDWSDEERRAAVAVRQHITGAMLVAVLDDHAARRLDRMSLEDAGGSVTP